MRIFGLLLAIGGLVAAWFYFSIYEISPKGANLFEASERSAHRNEAMWFTLGSSLIGVLLYGFSPPRKGAGE